MNQSRGSRIEARCVPPVETSDWVGPAAVACFPLFAWGSALRPQPVRVVKRGLKKIQYQPHLIDGCLTDTGLTLTYTPAKPLDIPN
jgi:hypothetical protein